MENDPVKDLLCAAYDALEYFEDREDVVDGDYGFPKANTEMRLAIALRDAIHVVEHQRARLAKLEVVK